jgi:REP element-mobilizing transposase RayT
MTHFFDPDANLEIYRRRLPHWRQAGVTYFVTFRLIDSLPTQKLVALRREKARWLALNPPPHNERQENEYHANFSTRVHTWLDAGHGKCVLAQPEIRQLVENALRFFNDQRYKLGEFVVMPNHVHVLVEPLTNHRLDRILHSWKSFSAKQINASTGSKGSIWHRESFDHIVRSPMQLARIEQYIRDNPKPLHGKVASTVK